MASIISYHSHKNRALVTFKLSFDEAEALKGKMRDIHLVAEETLGKKANIAGRGKGNCSKYFLVPKKLRADINDKKEAQCLMIETKDKMIWAYFVDKPK